MSPIPQRSIVAFVLAAACSLPAAADVTLRQKVSMAGMMSMQGESVTYIKGHKMRIESNMGKHSTVMLMDVDAKKTIILEGKKAEAFDMSAMMAQQALISDASIEFELKPTGKKREVAGATCEEHQLDMVVHAKAADDNPMGNMDIRMNGPGCSVKGAPGFDEYLAFYDHAVKVGYFFADPRAAQANPGRERAMTVMTRKMAETGMPYWSSFKVSIEGDGPMAAMMAKMAGMTLESTVTEVSTAPLADDLFQVPAGVKVKNN